MPELQALRADHEQSVLDFELVNRDYFAQSISDRGDDYFRRFAEQHQSRLAEQETGSGAYFVLVDDDGSVIGRFNLLLNGRGTADLGYRVAESAAGRGVATAAVRDLCQLAAEKLGVHTIRAAVADLNVASRRVLVKAGFVAVGPADPASIGGKVGTWYEREVRRSPCETLSAS
jgi:ribosomal-protein-alanine N-acetyltransferase